MGDLQQHLAWHWQHDGPQVLAISAAGRTQADPNQIQQVLAEFGIQLEPEMLEQVRLTKFCPTPDGAGAHIVLNTESGPVTLYYMPRTRVPSSPTRMRLEDGMEAVALNVERGSLAVIAESRYGYARTGARDLAPARLRAGHDDLKILEDSSREGARKLRKTIQELVDTQGQRIKPQRCRAGTATLPGRSFSAVEYSVA